MKKDATTTHDIELLPAPKEELRRRLMIFELLTDIERDMLHEIWFQEDHNRLFNRKRGRPVHVFD